MIVFQIDLVLLAGFVFHAIWVVVAVMTYRSRRGEGRARPSRPVKDAILELAKGRMTRLAGRMTESHRERADIVA